MHARQRHHGFPDPGSDGISLDGLGIEQDSPEFRAAEEACEDVMPGPDRTDAGGSGTSAGSEWASTWERIVPGGECACADGSEFAFWVREADPTKIVLYLEGAGACFDATTCAFTGDAENGYYDWNLSTEDPSASGIFDFTRTDNPFADYTFIYVPLCTGDLYLGDTTREYSPALSVQHNGFVNGTAALSYLAEHYPDAARVAVVGKTAGSSLHPCTAVSSPTSLQTPRSSCSAPSRAPSPTTPPSTRRSSAGGAPTTQCLTGGVNDGLTARDWGPTQFWIQAGLHDPDIVMARFDYAFDANAARTLESRGIDPSTALALIDANEATIEAAGVTQHSYTAPGDDHGIFEFEAFYELEVNGVTLVDWLGALLSGEPPDDVHCQDCEAA